jgi:hypothetical protein
VRGYRTAIAFNRQCEFAHLPIPVPEYRFHPRRKWRFDWAFPDQKIALEVQGGAYLIAGGRHTRGSGFETDAEKFSEAAILGWRILHVLPKHLADGRALVLTERALLGERPFTGKALQ